MSKAKKSEPVSKITKYQKYEQEVISRSQIKNAEYNPRFITTESKKELKRNIKKHGLVSPPTWNRRTGNLVGGHQRLEILDAIEGRGDYDISVCVIDVSEKEEVILNVQLNNPSMQGEWDLDKLAAITDEFDLTFDDMGFTSVDVDLMFDGDERFTELFDTPEILATQEQIDDIHASRNGARERLAERNGINWYTVVVFSTEKDREQFHRKISVPVYETYVTKDQLDRAYREK